MPLSRTWYTRGNVPVSDFSTISNLGKSVLWGLKAALKGELSGGTLGAEGARPSTANWTCVGSSDSSTAGLDATDRWLSTFDATKIVRAAAGVAHSWIVLQSPSGITNGPFYICIDYSTGLDYEVNIIGSKTAFTGGSTTARPTSTAEWTIANTVQFCENAAVNSSIHSVQDANGNFFFLGSKNTSGIFNWCLMGLQLVEARGGDLCNFFTAVNFLGTSRGAPQAVNGSSGFTTTLAGRTYNNSAAHTGGIQTATFGASTFQGLATANIIDSTFDVIPLYVWSSNANAGGIRGRIPDSGFIGAAPVGASDPNTSAQLRVVCGDFILPCSVVPVL